MDTAYFRNKTEELSSSLIKNLEKKGIQLPEKEKDLTVYKEFYTFLREHLPEHFSLATGKVRGVKHVLNVSCDLLIYRKWCQKFLNMFGGYIPADYIYALVSIDGDLTEKGLNSHCNLTNAVKSLYKKIKEDEGKVAEIIPLYSMLFAYRSGNSLLTLRTSIKEYAEKKSIEINHEPDLVCILDQGIMVKDWESGGNYKIIETGDDTLLWFFILLVEMLDRDGSAGMEPRKYLKEEREYRVL
jgi:hypothetical protein